MLASLSVYFMILASVELAAFKRLARHFRPAYRGTTDAQDKGKAWRFPSCGSEQPVRLNIRVRDEDSAYGR
jgi:hypothetical protein